MERFSCLETVGFFSELGDTRCGNSLAHDTCTVVLLFKQQFVQCNWTDADGWATQSVVPSGRVSTTHGPSFCLCTSNCLWCVVGVVTDTGCNGGLMYNVVS